MSIFEYDRVCRPPHTIRHGLRAGEQASGACWGGAFIIITGDSGALEQLAGGGVDDDRELVLPQPHPVQRAGRRAHHLDTSAAVGLAVAHLGSSLIAPRAAVAVLITVGH
jgi:hypothetical protein